MSTTVAGSSHKGSPIALLLLGTLCIIVWLVATVLRIQTSEAFLLHGATVSFQPDWMVFMQIPNLVMGKLSTDMAKAAMWGWGIELMYLICVVGYEHAKDSVRHSNEKLSRIFGTGLILIVGFDAYADFQYGSLPSGFWGQVGFAAITSFIVLFFGIVGIKLLERGLASFHA